MDSNAVIEVWIENKINELQNKITIEVESIIARNPESNFPNMGNTETMRWYAQIAVLKEFQEFYGIIPGKK